MTLKLSGNGYSSIRVINELGQTVLEQLLNTMQQDQYLPINLPAAPSGMYLLQVISQESVISRPFIIQK
jgi:hypothetical protein